MSITPQAYCFIFGYTILAFAIFLEPPEGEHTFFLFKFTNKVSAFVLTLLFGIFWAMTVNCIVYGKCVWWSWFICGYITFAPIIIMIAREGGVTSWDTGVVSFYELVSAKQ